MSLPAGLQRGVPEMMEINPSQPLTEAFEEEEEEEESELEEDMVSSSMVVVLDLTFFTFSNNRSA